MSEFKLGMIDSPPLFGVGPTEYYTTQPLPSPPSQLMLAYSIPQTGWNMFDNDTIGCCTIAGAGHLTMAWNAETQQIVHVPDGSEISTEYFGETGGQDTGLIPKNVLTKWSTVGLFSGQDKIVAFNSVPTNNILKLHQSIACYGGLYMGIQCPQSMQDDFANGTPILYRPGSPIEGGHCIIAVGYDQEYVDIVTWGKRVRCSYPFLANYLTEAWVIFPSEFSTAGHGTVPSLNLAALRADLNLV